MITGLFICLLSGFLTYSVITHDQQLNKIEHFIEVSHDDLKLEIKKFHEKEIKTNERIDKLYEIVYDIMQVKTAKLDENKKNNAKT